MVRNMRAMILRSGLTDQEVRTIRGMIVALVQKQISRESSDAAALYRLCAGRAGGYRLRHLCGVARQEQRHASLLARPSLCSCWAWAAAPIGCWASRRLALRAAQGLQHPRLARPHPASDPAGAPDAGRRTGLGLSGPRLYVGRRRRRCRQGLWPRRRPGAAGARADRGAGSAYGEALVRGQWRRGHAARPKRPSPKPCGSIPQDARGAFLSGPGAGRRMATRPGALALWQSLLADMPANAPLHQMLVDRIAMLTRADERRRARSPPDGGGPGGAAEGQSRRCGGLAAADPRLHRAGRNRQGQGGLATARKTFAAQRDVLAALHAEAKDLKLE